MPLSSALCGPCGELLRHDDDAPGVVAWLRMVAVVGAREDFLLDVRSDPPSAHVPHLARSGLDCSFGRRGLHEDAGASFGRRGLHEDQALPWRITHSGQVGSGSVFMRGDDGQSMTASSSAEDLPSRPGRSS